MDKNRNIKELIERRIQHHKSRLETCKKKKERDLVQDHMSRLLELTALKKELFEGADYFGIYSSAKVKKKDQSSLAKRGWSEADELFKF